MSRDQRRQRRKEDRPGEILEAALALFAEKGFAATRLEEVARRAGVSKGTVYLYFASKEDLFKSLVETMVVPEVERAEIVVQNHGGPARELLVHLVRQWWETVGETHLCGVPKLVLAEAGNFPALARYYTERVITRASRLIASVIERGIANGEFRHCDPLLTGRLLIAPLVFATIWKQSMAPFDAMDMRAFLEQHIDLFLNGLLVNREDGHAVR